MSASPSIAHSLDATFLKATKRASGTVVTATARTWTAAVQFLFDLHALDQQRWHGEIDEQNYLVRVELAHARTRSHIRELAAALALVGYEVRHDREQRYHQSTAEQENPTDALSS